MRRLQERTHDPLNAQNGDLTQLKEGESHYHSMLALQGRSRPEGTTRRQEHDAWLLLVLHFRARTLRPARSGAGRAFKAHLRRVQVGTPSRSQEGGRVRFFKNQTSFTALHGEWHHYAVCFTCLEKRLCAIKNVWMEEPKNGRRVHVCPFCFLILRRYLLRKLDMEAG